MSDSFRPHGLQHARLLSSTTSRSLLKFKSTESVMLSNHLSLCHPLLLRPSILPSISGSLLVSQFFTSGGVSATVLPKNIQDRERWLLSKTGERPSQSHGHTKPLLEALCQFPFIVDFKACMFEMPQELQV